MECAAQETLLQGGLAVRGDANNSPAGGNSLKRKQGSAAHESAHLVKHMRVIRPPEEPGQ